jgi:uncharacterized MAPEG superfamily protein
MTFAYWCVLAAALIPFLTVIPAKAAKDFDNHAPRLWEERRTGWRARGYWAHLNAFEAFPPFAAAVIIAHLAHGPQGRINLLAGIFIAARVAYSACYYADLATLRSVVWFLGFSCVVGLFVIAA